MRKLPRLLLFLTALLPALPAGAQTATLVADLNTDRESGAAGSAPRQLVTAGGNVFFVAGSVGAGAEVWVSDGTSAGTKLLLDACPGTCSSDPRILGNVGGLVFWVASSGNIYYENTLWRSDGTREGTFALTGPGVHMALGEEGTAAFLGDSLYFSGCDDESGCELWKSDGTVAGTHRLKDLVPGDFDGRPRDLTVVGNRLFAFGEAPGLPRLGLWVSDGTEAGTRLAGAVPDVYPGRLTAVGNKVFFTAESYPDGTDLWVSDGTEAGTRRVTDFVPDSPFRSSWLKAIGNFVYFVADDVANGVEIWRSDGTTAGTARVTEFGYYHAVEGLGASQLAELGGRLVYVATDGIGGFHLWATAATSTAATSTGATSTGATPASTTELCTDCNLVNAQFVAVGGRVVFANTKGPSNWQPWSTDGTREGTGAIPGVCSSRCSEPSGLVAALGTVLFVGQDRQIWRTDGTAAGTRRFTELPGEIAYPSGLQPVAAGLRIYFSAAAGGYGEELWVSDGKSEGTRLVADLAQEHPSSYPTGLVPLGDRIVFTACDGFSTELWQSTGSAGGTSRLTASPQQGFSHCGFDVPTGLTSLGPYTFFWKEGEFSSLQNLWRTDGTPEGTVQLTHLDQYLSDVPRLYALRGELVFLIETESFTGSPGLRELWQTDGTVAGTGKLLDLSPLVESIYSLHGLGDELYFVAYSSEAGLQIWRTDGTAAGTRQILGGTIDNGTFRFARAGSSVVFFAQPAYSSAAGKVWRTDGTAAGTVYIADLPAGNYAGRQASVPATFHGAAYFFTRTSEGRRALWRTDGTGLGTKMVRDFQVEPGTSDDPRLDVLVVAGDRLFFRAHDGVHGPELWQTDGTAEGTTLVRDIFPGATGSQPTWLQEGGGRLFFSAHDGVHGFELWQSDGTEAGTRLVQDVAPGPDSSYPQEVTAAGGRLYFSADDGYTGRELWTLPLAGGAGCQPSADHLCLGGGRFQAEARWRDFQGNAGTGTAVGLTADTGYFWFFDAGNVEVVVKVLDGRGINGHRWVFYGALSSVEYALTVTDTQTGATVRYVNPPGQLASVGDTRAFGPLGTKTVRRAAAATQQLDLIAERTDPKAATGSCQESANRLCLNGGRFAVESSWQAQGQSGAGTAVRLTGDTGYFWFFGADNVEVVLKVLDGRALNGKFWVFYGALSDVEYTLTVTDTQTGTVRTYANPAGRMASVADTKAF